MANIKISQMTSAASLTGEELIPIVQSGSNKTTTVQKVKEGLATVEQLNNKVDKDGNKVLSEQNFTTTLKNKLDGIEAQANKYEHPANHLASMITEDTTHRFVTDAEKSTWNNKADTEDIPDVSNLATKQELSSKQDTLVSGTNIKTVNGQSILGEGNIEIQGSGEGIADAPNDGSKYVRQNGNWVKETTVDTSTFATKDELNKKADKDEISDMLSKTEASSTYQPKGDYLTAIPDEYVTENELSEKGYLTEIPSEYVTDEELNAKGYATTTQLDSKLDTETYNSDKATFATKEELADKANTSDLSNYLQTSVAESTYAKKSEIPEEYTLPIATAEALGGIKVGAGLSINPETGVLSANGGGTADSVDWANITSKPEEFKPEVHQHVTADVTDLQDKLDAKADASAIADMATKTWVGEQGYLTEHQDISNLATKDELNEKANTSDLGNYVTTSTANSTFATKEELGNINTILDTINGEVIS